jgi:hypothetical protein
LEFSEMSARDEKVAKSPQRLDPSPSSRRRSNKDAAAAARPPRLNNVDMPGDHVGRNV